MVYPMYVVCAATLFSITRSITLRSTRYYSWSLSG